MRILYITPCWPHGRSFGGQLRALHIGRALQQLGEVTVAVVSGDDPEPGALEKTRAEFDLHGQIRIEPTPDAGVTERIRRWTNPRFMNVHGCVANGLDRAALLDRMPEFALIWVLNSRTPNNLRQWRWPRAVLDLDDIPSTFHDSVRRTAPTAGGRWKAALQSRMSQRREALWKGRFDTLCVCSESDRNHLGGGPQIHVVPNGFARPDKEPVHSPAQPPRIGFIGLLSYMPNLEGVRWFVRDCWPLIRKEIPDARLRLVGKETDGSLKPEGPAIDALGFVADPSAEIATWSAMIIPVRQGAGTRVKVAEAFSRKCPVVSTALGAYGYDVTDGIELCLADKPQAFVDHCVSLAREPKVGDAMAKRAWTRFLQNWTWDAITHKVRAAAEHSLRATERANCPSFVPLQRET